MYSSGLILATSGARQVHWNRLEGQAEGTRLILRERVGILRYTVWNHLLQELVAQPCWPVIKCLCYFNCCCFCFLLLLLYSVLAMLGTTYRLTPGCHDSLSSASSVYYTIWKRRGVLKFLPESRCSVPNCNRETPKLIFQKDQWWLVPKKAYPTLLGEKKGNLKCFQGWKTRFVSS